MSRLFFRSFTLAVSIVLAGTFMALGDNDAGTLNGISDYRRWTKLNPEPVKVDTPLGIVSASLAGD